MLTNVSSLPIGILCVVFQVLVPDLAFVLKAKLVGIFYRPHLQVEIISVIDLLLANLWVSFPRRISWMIKEIHEAIIIHKKKSTPMVCIVSFKFIRYRCLWRYSF